MVGDRIVQQMIMSPPSPVVLSKSKRLDDANTCDARSRPIIMIALLNLGNEHGERSCKQQYYNLIQDITGFKISK